MPKRTLEEYNCMYTLENPNVLNYYVEKNHLLEKYIPQQLKKMNKKLKGDSLKK